MPANIKIGQNSTNTVLNKEALMTLSNKLAKSNKDGGHCNNTETKMVLSCYRSPKKYLFNGFLVAFLKEDVSLKQETCSFFHHCILETQSYVCNPAQIPQSLLQTHIINSQFISYSLYLETRWNEDKALCDFKDQNMQMRQGCLNWD